MLRTELLTFGVAGAVFRIAGEMRRLPAYFDNPGGVGINVFGCSNPVLVLTIKPIRALIPFYMQDTIHFHLF